MNETIKITWQVGDGYAGKDRPQRTRIPLEDFDGEMSDDEIFEIISGYVEADFEQKITADFDYDKNVEAVRAALAAGKDER